MAFVPRAAIPDRTPQPVGQAGRIPHGRFDRIIFALIDRAEADPTLGERTDILALLLRSRCDDGTAIPRHGHLRRAVDPHRCRPRNLDSGVELGCSSGCGAIQTCWPNWSGRSTRAAANSAGPQFRRSLRVRTVLDAAGRRVRSPNFDLGGWRIPQGHTVIVRLADIHENPEIYPHPERFDPNRFLGTKPAPPDMAGVRCRSTAVRRR